MVYLIQAYMVNFKLRQSLNRHRPSDYTICHHLSIVSNSLEQSISDARCAPSSTSYLLQPGGFGFYLENTGGTFEDFLYGYLVIKIEAVDSAKAVSERRAQQSKASGGPNQSEGGEA